METRAVLALWSTNGKRTRHGARVAVAEDGLRCDARRRVRSPFATCGARPAAPLFSAPMSELMVSRSIYRLKNGKYAIALARFAEGDVDDADDASATQTADLQFRALFDARVMLQALLEARARPMPDRFLSEDAHRADAVETASAHEDGLDDSNGVEGLTLQQRLLWHALNYFQSRDDVALETARDLKHACKERGRHARLTSFDAERALKHCLSNPEAMLPAPRWFAHRIAPARVAIASSVETGRAFRSADGAVVFWLESAEDADAERVMSDYIDLVVATTGNGDALPNNAVDACSRHCSTFVLGSHRVVCVVPPPSACFKRILIPLLTSSSSAMKAFQDADSPSIPEDARGAEDGLPMGFFAPGDDSAYLACLGVCVEQQLDDERPRVALRHPRGTWKMHASRFFGWLPLPPFALLPERGEENSTSRFGRKPALVAFAKPLAQQLAFVRATLAHAEPLRLSSTVAIAKRVAGARANDSTKAVLDEARYWTLVERCRLKALADRVGYPLDERAPVEGGFGLPRIAPFTLTPTDDVAASLDLPHRPFLSALAHRGAAVETQWLVATATHNHSDNAAGKPLSWAYLWLADGRPVAAHGEDAAVVRLAAELRRARRLSTLATPSKPDVLLAQYLNDQSTPRIEPVVIARAPDVAAADECVCRACSTALPTTTEPDDGIVDPGALLDKAAEHLIGVGRRHEADARHPNLVVRARRWAGEIPAWSTLALVGARVLIGGATPDAMGRLVTVGRAVFLRCGNAGHERDLVTAALSFVTYGLTAKVVPHPHIGGLCCNLRERMREANALDVADDARPPPAADLLGMVKYAHAKAVAEGGRAASVPASLMTCDLRWNRAMRAACFPVYGFDDDDDDYDDDVVDNHDDRAPGAVRSGGDTDVPDARPHAARWGRIEGFSASELQAGVEKTLAEPVVFLPFSKSAKWPMRISVASAAVGHRHAALVTSTGLCLTLGATEAGRLGLGRTRLDEEANVVHEPQLVTGLAKRGVRVVAVDCGRDHTCCVTACGRGFAWGWGEGGRLGLGSDRDAVWEPARVLTPERLIDISCGREHTLWLASSSLGGGGFPLACGVGSCGRLGLGPSVLNKAILRPMRIEIDGVVDVVSVAAGEAHSLARDDAGYAYAWGFGGSGALGFGDYSDIDAPARIPELRGITSLGAGAYHSAFVSSNGRCFTCGDGLNGQLGMVLSASLSNEPNTTATPIWVTPAPPFASVTCGGTTTWAVTETHRVYQWGLNEAEESRSTDFRALPTAVDVGTTCGERPVRVAAGVHGALAYVLAVDDDECTDGMDSHELDGDSEEDDGALARVGRWTDDGWTAFNRRARASKSTDEDDPVPVIYHRTLAKPRDDRQRRRQLDALGVSTCTAPGCRCSRSYPDPDPCYKPCKTHEFERVACDAPPRALDAGGRFALSADGSARRVSAWKATADLDLLGDDLQAIVSCGDLVAAADSHGSTFVWGPRLNACKRHVDGVRPAAVSERSVVFIDDDAQLSEMHLRKDDDREDADVALAARAVDEGDDVWAATTATSNAQHVESIDGSRPRKLEPTSSRRATNANVVTKVGSDDVLVRVAAIYARADPSKSAAFVKRLVAQYKGRGEVLLSQLELKYSGVERETTRASSAGSSPSTYLRSPVRIKLPTFKDSTSEDLRILFVAASRDSVCAVAASGARYAWGGHGTLDGIALDANLPKLIGSCRSRSKRVVALTSCGRGGHFILVDSEGAAYGWGDDAHSQLVGRTTMPLRRWEETAGDGDQRRSSANQPAVHRFAFETLQIYAPSRSSGSAAVGAAAGAAHSLLLLDNGSVLGRGRGFSQFGFEELPALEPAEFRAARVASSAHGAVIFGYENFEEL